MEFSAHRQVLCVEEEQDVMKHTEERESEGCTSSNFVQKSQQRGRDKSWIT